MLRTLLTSVSAIIMTLIVAPLVILFGLFSSSAAAIDRVIRLWARGIVAGAGIDLRIENPERLRADQRYILVANHHSYLDIPCLLAIIPQPLRFMAKVSLFKVPLFGWGLQAAGFIPIDRKDRRKAVKSFDLAGERIRKGNSIAIFPEEGRSRDRSMRPFQRGAFLLAIKSKLPIVPVAIDGTYDVLGVGRRDVRPGIVTVRIDEAIETGNLGIRDKDELMARVRERIETMLGERNSER